MYKPYSIITPPFDPTSGGIRVMYGLYGALLAKGQIVFPNASYSSSNFIAVYPEIYHGNPAGAGTVVRYILATPGSMGLTSLQGFKHGPLTFDTKNEKVYVFSKIYDTIGVNRDHLMFLPILNLHIFKDYKKERTKTCYLIGKGVNQQKHPKDSIELTRQFATDQTSLADLLNECHTLYGYDRLSAMYEIARLCGCTVNYYGDFTKEQMQLYEPGLDGMSFDGEPATLDSNSFYTHYMNLIWEFNRKLDLFIDDTQQ